MMYYRRGDLFYYEHESNDLLYFQSTDFDKNVTPKAGEIKPKVGSMANKDHKPKGGEKQIFDEKLKVNADSKIGSKDKIDHRPGGGEKKIFNEKVNFNSKVTSKVGSMDKKDYKPGGGEKKIENRKLNWNVQSKIGSLDNAKHVPTGGDKKVVTQKLNWSGQSKVGSLDNAKHNPKGGDKKVFSEPVKWNAESKVGSMDNATHLPGGGDKKIFDEQPQWNADSKVGSLDNADHEAGGGKDKIFDEKLTFDETSGAKVHSLDNKDYEPKSSGIKIYEEKLPWREHNKPKVTETSREESPAGFDRERARSYDIKVKEQSSNSPAKMRPRPLNNEREQPQSVSPDSKSNRQKQIEYDKKVREQSTTNNKSPPKSNNQPAAQNTMSKTNGYSHNDAFVDKTSGQTNKNHVQKDSQDHKNGRKTEQAPVVTAPQATETQQHVMAVPRESRKDKHEKKTTQPNTAQTKPLENEKIKTPQPAKPTQYQEQPKVASSQNTIKDSTNNNKDDYSKLEKQSTVRTPKSPTKTNATVEKPVSVKMESNRPNPTVRDEDAWEYARHEYDQPKSSPRKTPKSVSHKENESSETKKENETQPSSPSRGIKDLYKTEGYAARHEIAPANIPVKSLLIKPLAENYKHEWKNKAEIKVRMDEDGLLVFKSNYPQETKLPRVADYEENFPVPTYTSIPRPSNIKHKNEQKPRKITEESLDTVFPKTPDVQTGNQKKHYSQYYYSKEKHTENTYEETMRHSRAKETHRVNKPKKGKIFLDSDGYNNQFYSEVRLEDAEIVPANEAYGKYTNRSPADRHEPQSERYSDPGRPETDNLYDNLLVRTSHDYMHHQYDDMAGVGDYPHHNYLPPIFSNYHQTQSLNSLDTKRKKRFVFWNPGEQPFANSNTNEEISKLTYTEKLEMERQKRYNDNNKGFIDLYKQKKNWFDNYNEKMSNRYGKVEKVSQKDLLMTTYELY